MEREFLDRSPSLVVLYGDVNSTVGAALAGAKLGVPLAHVEAGLRSFDNTMPEEINRRLTDQLCDLLFCTSPEALGHLAREGRPGLGDALRRQPDDRHAGRQPGQVRRRPPPGRRSAWATAGTSSPPCTGPANVDSPERAAELVAALHEVAAELDVIIPLHPRGRATLTAAGLLDASAHPRGGSARLRRVHVAGARSGSDRHRFGRRAGGDYAAARALPYPPAQHRAADHHHQRVQPPRDPRGAGGRGAEGQRRRPLRGRAPAALGRPRRAQDRRGSSPPGSRRADDRHDPGRRAPAATAPAARPPSATQAVQATWPRTRGSRPSASGWPASSATPGCSWP